MSSSAAAWYPAVRKLVARLFGVSLGQRIESLPPSVRPFAVELTAKEFKLLSYMATRRGCALTRDDILNAVWGHSVFVTPRSVDRCVTTLRAKIDLNPGAQTFIETIRDIGYRFDPPGA